MQLFDIDTLRFSFDREVKYNLFNITFQVQENLQQSPYVVGRDAEMRMDSISFDIYESANELDFLCNLNDIDNPLNVMEGDIVFFTAYGAIDSFRIRQNSTDETRNRLLNVNKNPKKDKNRQKYVEDGFQLPPTFTPVPTPPARIVGNNIIIGQV
jgi:hypothetical protein